MPLSSIAWFIPGNTVEVLISAIGLRYCFNSVPRLNSVRALAKYSFFAIVLAPFAGAFLSAHGIASDYWTGWKIVFLSEVLAFVTVTPALLSWVSEGRALMRRSRAHHLEGLMLIAGLVLVSYIVFTVREDNRSPALFYTLVPFLLWSALRFGSLGVSTSLVAVTSLSIWGAVHGRGPFSDRGPLLTRCRCRCSWFSLRLLLWFWQPSPRSTTSCAGSSARAKSASAWLQTQHR